MQRLLLVPLVGFLCLLHAEVNADEHQSIVYFDVVGLRDAYPSRIITFSHIDPSPLIPRIRKYIPPIQGSFVGIGPIGTVILSDSQEQMGLFTKLLNVLDSRNPVTPDQVASEIDEVSKLMAEISANYTLCGDTPKTTAGVVSRHSVPLGSFDQKWVVVINNFLNHPESLEVSKEENTISFEDTEEKYVAIKSLLRGLQNVPLKTAKDQERTNHAVDAVERFFADDQKSNGKSRVGTPCN